jgi:hypothetical protein
MTGKQLAKCTLRLDAAWCVVSGAAVAAYSKRIAHLLEVPMPLVAAAGGATMVWGGAVAAVSTRDAWRPATGFVVGANTLAAAGLAGWAVAHHKRSARLALVLVAADVLALGVAQTIALAMGTADGEEPAEDRAAAA